MRKMDWLLYLVVLLKSKLGSVARPRVVVGWSALRLWYFLIILYARIQEISSGVGGGGCLGPSVTLHFFSLQLNLQKSNGFFSKKTIIFQGCRGGSTFSKGGGIQLLIPYNNPNNL